MIHPKITTCPSAATAANLALVKAETDKLADTLEDNAGTYRFTSAALSQAPDSTSDATEAKQDTIIANIAALNDPSSSDIVTALLAATVDGSQSVEDTLKILLSAQHGKVVRTGTDPLTLQYYEQDTTTLLYTVTVASGGTGRTSS